MPTRRSFIGGALATLAALAVGRRAIARPSAINVTGKPTPASLHRGVSGHTYFNAKDYCQRVKCYLDDADVSDLASECDTEGGWIRMYQRGPDGLFAETLVPSADPKDQRKYRYYGNWREIPAGMTVASVEYIHFGKVEVR